MTLWNPVWNVTIDGVDYTNAILANLKITSGRRNIYEQANAGYVNIELIDLNQAIIPVHVNSSIAIQLKDTSGTFVTIFGGNVVDIFLTVRDSGNVSLTQTYAITALGALARLPKSLTDGALDKDFDGNQIYTILEGLLLNTWSDVPTALDWASYDPTTTWADAENTGLGQIDRPGNYELAKRNSNRINVYSLVSALATSGLGYLYESGDGLINYADSTHRSQYLSANGYVQVTANHAQARGLQTQTRAGDVRNNITLQYAEDSTSEVSATNLDSMAEYGTLAQIIQTTVFHAGDALDQANFYLALRANPQAMFSEIAFNLTNPELDDDDRDSLINVFMGMPVAINDLPANMGSIYQGFVEGWTFRASYNELEIAMIISPTAFSLQSLEWQEISSSYDWAGVAPTLDWQRATIVV